MDGIGLLDHGGAGRPIVLVHGLMGRGRTWARHTHWLTKYGRVFTFDAAFHNGLADCEQPRPETVRTERFVADIAEILTWIDLGPAVLVGHSMGAMHSWVVAAQFPELVSALVVEDMVPDFTGQTGANWTSWFDTWPSLFGEQELLDTFGPVAGEYFRLAFDDGHLHGEISTWQQIANVWKDENHWDSWHKVTAPSLLLQAGASIDPGGQMAKMAESENVVAYLVSEKAGHLLHDDTPTFYRGAVEAFLARPDICGETLRFGR